MLNPGPLWRHTKVRLAITMIAMGDLLVPSNPSEMKALAPFQPQDHSKVPEAASTPISGALLVILIPCDLLEQKVSSPVQPMHHSKVPEVVLIVKIAMI